MNEIRRVLKQASARLMLIDLLRTLSVTMAAAVGALIVALFIERIFGVAIAWPRQWIQLAGICAGAALVMAVAWSLFRRHRGVALARELDERANLKETLSTAMCVSASDDPWAKAVLDTARERAVSVNVRQAIPITAPKVWPLPFAMALALVVLWFSIPHWDVMGLFKQRQIAAEAEEARIQATSESKAAEEKVLQKLPPSVDLRLDEATKEGGDGKEPQDPDEIRRAAVKRLTSLTEKLNDMKSGEKAQQLQAIKEAMKQLKQPGPGPLDQMSRSLAKGDFKKAQEDLQELSKQLANDSLSKEDKDKLQQQLEKMKQQLEQLAESRQDLEKQLEKAGMSKEQAQQAAKNPEALKRALEEMQNLSDEQKQQLMQQAKAQSQACEACNGMGEAMAKMAQGLSQEGMNAEGMEGMEGLAGQLSELEMAQMDMESLDAAASEAMKQLAKMASQCKGGGEGMGEGEGQCEGQGPWRAGDTLGKMGNGSGGPGQGNGMSPQGEDAPVSIEKTKAQSKNTGGPIIGSRLIYGEQVKGESTAEFMEAVESKSKAATEALSNNLVRRELQGAVKHYFGKMEERAKSTQK